MKQIINSQGSIKMNIYDAHEFACKQWEKETDKIGIGWKDDGRFFICIEKSKFKEVKIPKMIGRFPIQIINYEDENEN